MPEKGTLRERILALMHLAAYRPKNKGEIAQELGLSAEQRPDLRAELASLEREGTVVRGKRPAIVCVSRRGITLLELSVSSPGEQRGFIQTRRIRLMQQVTLIWNVSNVSMSVRRRPRWRWMVTG